MVERLIVDLELFEFAAEAFQSRLIPQVQVIERHDLLSPLLRIGLELRLEVFFDEGAANIGVGFEVKVGLRVHREERFEELLIAVEMIMINLDVKPFRDSVQVLLLVLLLVIVFILESQQSLLFVVAGVHYRE